MAAAGDEPETVEMTLRAVGPSRPTTLRLPPLLSVAELRRRVSRDRRLAATEEVRLRLVLRGRTLPHQDDAHWPWHLSHLLSISVTMTMRRRKRKNW
nr:unnamed protein product [Digitaria exilis]CAB3503102.1 unnamed protein product [Digitaria exilis]